MCWGTTHHAIPFRLNHLVQYSFILIIYFDPHAYVHVLSTHLGIISDLPLGSLQQNFPDDIMGTFLEPQG